MHPQGLKNLQMNKQTGLILFSVLTLSACASTSSRQAGSQPAVQVVEAQSMQLEHPIPAPATAQSTAQATIQPGHGGYLEGDGPGADVPANLDETPDAVPHAEPLHPYANRPYIALGQTYTPLTVPGNYKERGIASWYGKKFHGQRTSSGETYDMYGMTAAHPTLPIPSYARVTNLANNKSVVVRINDRGPFLHDRIMDLSYVAAHKLGIVGNGSSEVEVTSIAPDSTVATSIAIGNPVTSEPLAPTPVTAPAATTEPPVATAAPPVGDNVYLQIGAFKSQQGAESFLAKMRPEFDGSGKQLVLYQKDNLVRVHIGPYASLDEAHAIAEKLQSRLGFKPIVSLH
jgi:rare lipoprotein A